MLNNAVFESVSTDTILELIEVQRPYFALSDFYLDQAGWYVAKAPVQCPSQYESCLMNASEVGRHLAILGSCCGALVNPKKSRHYYLASKARLDTYSGYISDVRTNFLYARAKAEFVSKRELHADTELLNLDGQVIARLSVEYHVLLEKSFNKVYGSNQIARPLFNADDNPYERPVKLEPIRCDEMSYEARIGTVQAELCVGHFDRVRSLPVAILSQCFLNASYAFLCGKTDDSDAKFVLKGCDLAATKLATAGQEVSILVNYVNFEEGVYITQCTATNQLGEVVGEMRCFIEKL